MPPRRTPARPRARSTKTYLFSYGSNSPRQLAERLGHPVQGRAAFVDGYLRAFRGWSQRWEGGVATLIPGRGKTYGYVAEVTPADLAVLDRYEGVATGNYYRETMTVTTDDGTVQAIAYLASSTEKNAPSRAYKRAVAETIGAFWEGSNGPVTEEDITVRNNPRGKVKRFGKPLPFYLPAQARDLFDPRDQTLTLSKDMFNELAYASKLLALDDESVPLNRREKAYIYMLGGAKERGGLVVLPVTKPAALFMLGEGSPLDLAMDIASGEVAVRDARRRAGARRTFHGMKQISEVLYKAYILPRLTVNPRPHRRNPASNLFYHATRAGKNGEVLASVAEGIDTTRAKGFGQGAGFYMWANRDRALRHLGDIVSGGLSKEVAVEGDPIIIVLDVPLNPEDYDIDYEAYAEGFVKFMVDNDAWFTANADTLVFPFSFRDDGEFADTTFKFTPHGVQWFVGSRFRKGTVVLDESGDAKTGRLLSAFARRLAEVAPDMFRRFEAEMLPRASAVKYVGPRVQPLRIEGVDGTVLWKRGDPIPRRTNPLTRRNSRF